MDPKLLIFVLVLSLAENVLPVRFSSRAGKTSQNASKIIPEYVYRFGKEGRGAEIYRKETWIGWLRFTTNIVIPVPPDTQVTFVKVTVKAINPPKVDYDDKTRTVSIKYSLVEFSGSSYKIYAEGMKLY